MRRLPFEPKRLEKCLLDRRAHDQVEIRVITEEVFTAALCHPYLTITEQKVF